MINHPPWSFDIDKYLNKVVPSPPWRYLPYPVAYFLGHREKPARNVGNLTPVFWAFIGIWCSLSIIMQVDMHVHSFNVRGAPMIVGSFGAAAVLEFYSIEAPLAQPRNAILGQIISALTGVAVCKLFLLSSNFETYRWAGGALACAAATSLMALTKTVHPPAGATALLAVVDDRIVDVGWFLVPMIMLGCGLMLAVALLVNNIERRFPIYWWTPEKLGKDRKKAVEEDEKKKDSNESQGSSEGEAKGDAGSKGQGAGGKGSGDEEGGSPLGSMLAKHEAEEIIIRPGRVVIPVNLQLRQEEISWLEGLADRM